MLDQYVFDHLTRQIVASRPVIDIIIDNSYDEHKGSSGTLQFVQFLYGIRFHCFCKARNSVKLFVKSLAVKKSISNASQIIITEASIGMNGK